MTWFGICTMGLLGLRRWKLWMSSWKVTVDDVHSLHISSISLTSFNFQGGWHSKTVIVSLYFFFNIIHSFSNYETIMSFPHSYWNDMHYLFFWGSEGHNVYVNCMHMMFWGFFAPEFNCLTIWTTVKLESSTHALLANSEALWLLALRVVFVLFF